MIRTVFFLLITLLALPVLANDIAVSAADGHNGWLLLENPPGAAGATLSSYAGDPGLPAPDALGWPHRAGARPDGTYPETELWHYDSATGRFTRATHYLGSGKQGSAYRRTLYAVFAVAGTPFVLHFDPYRTLGGYTQVLRVGSDAASAQGAVPGGAIALNSTDFMEAPAVSPDGKHVAFRAFRDNVCTLRVYATQSWTLVAESEARTFARPTWCDNATLAAIAWDGDKQPEAAQRDPALKFSTRLLESHAPKPGKLLRAELSESALKLSELLAGEFPPDHYTRSVLGDPFGLGLVLARKDGDEIVVELREPKPEGKARVIARYAAFRGACVALGRILCAGVREVERANTFVLTDLHRWGEVRLPGRTQWLPLGEREHLQDFPLAHISPDGHGGMIDLGRGVMGVLEPVVNPDYDPARPEAAQLLRHTITVDNWAGCSSMRNPRILQRLSKLVRRFEEIGQVRSTILAFDIKIAANQGANEKNGRYIELYSSAGRKGKGRIRTEDNLGGSWLVQSIDGGGEMASDDYYTWAGAAPKAPPKMDSQPAARSGKAYDDLVTQLETRKLLMFSDAEKAVYHGGLLYLQAGHYRDPNSGATWRTWVYARYGRVLNDADQGASDKIVARLDELAGKLNDPQALEEFDQQMKAWWAIRRERVIVRFVADLPIGSAGDWKFPHAIAQVQMRFALANQQEAAVTELTFEPDRWVALPHLVDLETKTADKRRPELLLPAVFRIYERNKEGKLEEKLKAVAVEKAFDHPVGQVKAGKVTPGYEVPLVAFSNRQFIELQR
ncbi:MAG: hypothetical protein H6841_10220 [Planctomycetes bacterium]|nr:hypothetical protein [Planctomycetota bacterium]